MRLLFALAFCLSAGEMTSKGIAHAQNYSEASISLQANDYFRGVKIADFSQTAELEFSRQGFGARVSLASLEEGQFLNAFDASYSYYTEFIVLAGGIHSFDGSENLAVGNSTSAFVEFTGREETMGFTPFLHFEQAFSGEEETYILFRISKDIWGIDEKWVLSPFVETSAGDRYSDTIEIYDWRAGGDLTFLMQKGYSLSAFANIGKTMNVVENVQAEAGADFSGGLSLRKIF